MKNWYQMSKNEIFDKLSTPEQGLSSIKAAEILEKNGKNVLKESKKKTPLKVFLSQFADMLVIILIIAAIIYQKYSIHSHCFQNIRYNIIIDNVWRMCKIQIS